MKTVHFFFGVGAASVALLISLAVGGCVPSPDIAADSSLPSDQVSWYLELPIDGQIGTDVTPEMVRMVLDHAKSHGVKHIVVRINTGGGYVPPAEAIWNLMYEYEKDFQYHAYIEKAVSAGIWMAFASHTMHMTPTAIFGAASVYDTLSDNSVRLNEKSSAIFAAQIVSRSVRRGYDPVIVRGMVVPGAEVWAWQGGDGKPRIAGYRPDINAGPTLVCLDNPHTLLTLTAPEARFAGLIGAFSSSMDGIGSELGIGGWKRYGGLGQALSISRKYQHDLDDFYKMDETLRGNTHSVSLTDGRLHSMLPSLYHTSRTTPDKELFASVRKRLDQALALANDLEPEWLTASLEAKAPQEAATYVRNWRQKRHAADQAWKAIDELASRIEEEYRQATGKECRLPFLYTDRIRQSLNAVWDLTEKSFEGLSGMKEQS